MPLLLGATINRADLLDWEPRLPANGLMWIEPNSDGMPPSWSDPRFAYCQRHGTIPVIGMRTGGDSSKYETLWRHLSNMPNWLPKIYVTDHAEPERAYGTSPTAFIDNFRDWYLGVIQVLPAAIRAKVFAGPVLSATWTEESGGGDYTRFDPGLAYSDFFGVELVQLVKAVESRDQDVTRLANELDRAPTALSGKTIILRQPTRGFGHGRSPGTRTPCRARGRAPARS